MDDATFSKKANISAINRFDNEVKDIIVSASQVALYVFNQKKSTWIKRKVEGACFLYKRKTSPKYGIFILNRLDTTNFIELMNSTMELQLQEPYLLYRNIFKTIYGIWFYEKTECIAMANIFQRIIKELKDKEKDDQDDEKSEQLMDDAKSNKGVGSSNGQPDSVRQFFEKASKPMSIPHSSSNRSVSGSFQSVAHIEKCQKSDNSRSLDFDSDKDLRDDVHPKSRKSNVSKNDDNEGQYSSFENSLRALNIDSSGRSNSMGFCEDLPELIPPAMLLTPFDIASSSTANAANVKTPLLDKSQMIQAFEYLLKHDSHFTDKLYDAYLKLSKTN